MSSSDSSPPGFDATLLTALRERIEDLPHGTFTLSVVGDPKRRVVVDGLGPALVGKSTICDLVLDDPLVSRRHCRFEIAGPRLRVTDLGSSNGTWVGGVQIRDGFLSGGERVAMGGTELQVEHQRDGQNPEVPVAEGFGRLLGQSRSMRRLYPLAMRLAKSRVPVLIEGETGTGKEVLAEALHEEGPFAAEPFVVFDCTAVPEGLLESELFGHEKGAFTGAIHQRKGVFELAHRGTLFIDEIGDLPLTMQPKLLRAIERGQVRRVGGDRMLDVDVRIMAATRRNLDAEVQAGRFRDDLFHRLAVTRIELPPLRSRLEDIRMLANHFHRQAGGDGQIPEGLLTRWRDEPWPGNVRELRNAVSRLVAIGAPSEGAFGMFDPPPSFRGGDYLSEVLSKGLPLARARAMVVDEFERRYLANILELHGGVVTKAAESSGVARRHFQRLRAKSR